VEEPIHIDLGLSAGVANPHVVILVGKGARARVLQRLYSLDGGPLFCNLGSDIRLAEEASLEIAALQNLGDESYVVNHADAVVNRYGVLRHFSSEIGGSAVKSRLTCSLAGPGSEAEINGVYLCSGRQHMDLRTVQRHLAPQTASRAFYKGGARDEGRAVYQGLIEVAPGAAKTDAYLTNRNLLLNDGARADSIPSLQIKTDDVRCSHGSTTGRINESEVFYLMSRGLDRAEAESMLAMGFFEDLLEPVSEPLAGELRELLAARLAARSREPLAARSALEPAGSPPAAS
jgi:Fe-S cluster assembly protein SufD